MSANGTGRITRAIAVNHVSRRLAHPVGADADECYVWLDKHHAKNGGTTVRTMMSGLAREGFIHHLSNWAYQSTDWQALLSDMVRRDDGPICNRTHNAWRGRRFALESHEKTELLEEGWVAPLRAYRRQSGCCKVVLTARVRQPFDYYTSFYRWGVQPRFVGSKAKGFYNHSNLFLVWAPPNIQTEILMRGSLSTHILDGTRHSVQPNGAPWSLSALVPCVNAESHEQPCATKELLYWLQLSRSLVERFSEMVDDGDIDLAYPTERSDAMLPILTSLLALSPHDEALAVLSHVKPVAPRWGRTSGGLTGEERDHAVDELCPNLSHCRARIASVSPLDNFLYEHVSRHFAKRLAGAAPRVLAAPSASVSEAAGHAAPSAVPSTSPSLTPLPLASSVAWPQTAATPHAKALTSLVPIDTASLLRDSRGHPLFILAHPPKMASESMVLHLGALPF